MNPRYAVYFVPERDSILYQLGATLLGRCVYGEQKLKLPDFEKITLDYLKDLTAIPRFYGFHGTIKAPFELAGQKMDLLEVDLLKALDDFSLKTQAFSLPKLQITLMKDDFLALTPISPSPELVELEKNLLTELKPFNAPLSPKDIERRGALSEKQLNNLKLWGYHLVFDDFTFHLTLTGRLYQPEVFPLVKGALKEYLASALLEPVFFGHLTLLYQKNRSTPFTVINTFKLRG